MGHKPLLRSAVDLQSQEATSNWPLNWNLAARLEKLGCLPQQCWNNSRLGMNESSRYPHKILSLLKLRCPMNATRKQHTPETSGATSKHSYLTQHVTILRHDDTNVLSRWSLTPQTWCWDEWQLLQYAPDWALTMKRTTKRKVVARKEKQAATRALGTNAIFGPRPTHLEWSKSRFIIAQIVWQQSFSITWNSLATIFQHHLTPLMYLALLQSLWILKRYDQNEGWINCIHEIQYKTDKIVESGHCIVVSKSRCLRENLIQHLQEAEIHQDVLLEIAGENVLENCG